MFLSYHLFKEYTEGGAVQNNPQAFVGKDTCSQGRCHQGIVIDEIFSLPLAKH